MTTAAPVAAPDARAASGRQQQHADVLVIFGITGDLARVMTFRSLYRLERARAARLPDRRRGGRRLDRRPARRARPRRRSSAPASSSTRRCSTGFADRLSYVQGDFADAATYGARRRRDQGRRAPGLLPGDPAVPVRHGGEGPAEAGLTKHGPRRRGEAVRPRPRLGAGARRRAAPVHRRVAALPDRPLPRQDGPRGDPLPPLREHDARAGVEPQLRRVACRSRWPRTSASTIAATSTTRSARCATWWSTTSCRSSSAARDGGAGRRRPDDDQGRADRAVPRDRRGRPGALRARSARRLPRHRRRRARLHHRDLRRAAARHRQLALVGRAVLHPHRQAAAGHADRAAARVQEAAAARLRQLRPDAGANQLVVQLDPSTGIRFELEAHRADAATAEPIHLDMVFADEGGEGATPYEVLLHAAMNGDSTRFTRQDGVEETWRIMQPLLDAPPPVHRTRRAAGGPRRPTSSSPGTVAGTSRGWHRERPRRADRPEDAERGGAVAVPADRRLRVPVRLPHRRARRARRRDRLAVRAALRRAERVRQRCSTARPASSASARSASTTRPPAHYEPGTNVLVTTWRTPSGWVVVRDALTIGPWDREDTITPHTRPPADDDGEHMLVRTVECLEGRVEMELVCEPAFDYGRAPADVDARRRRPAHRRRDRRRRDRPAAHRPRARHRGRPGARPATC